MKPESLKELIRLEFNELLDSQFGEVEYLDEVKDFAQKILEDRFKEYDEFLQTGVCRHKRVMINGDEETQRIDSIRCIDCEIPLTRKTVNGEYQYIEYPKDQECS